MLPGDLATFRALALVFKVKLQREDDTVPDCRGAVLFVCLDYRGVVLFVCLHGIYLRRRLIMLCLSLMLQCF